MKEAGAAHDINILDTGLVLWEFDIEANNLVFLSQSV